MFRSKNLSTKNRSRSKLLKLVDFHTLFDETTGTRILNNSLFTGKKVNEERIAQLFYDTDPELGFVATCECREYRGNYYLGHKCPHCGTVVSSEFTDDMTHINWIVLPDFAPPVLHPIFFLILKDWLGKTKSANQKIRGKISVLQTILDPSENILPAMKSHIRKQGFRYFYENHEEIMDYLFNVYKPATKANNTTTYIKKIYEMYKDILFVRKLPVLHPSLTPMAKEGKMKAIDPASAWAMAAIADLSTMGYEARRCLTSNVYQDRMLWKIYTDMISYVELVITKKFGDKYAHVRRHIMGARIHFSARSVIVPITEPHMADELHLPWKIVLGGLKLELINYLTNRLNYSLVDALTKYTRALVVYDEEIYQMIMTLMKECPYKGFPVLCGRNPYWCRA